MNKVTESANLQVDSSFKIYLSPDHFTDKCYPFLVIIVGEMIVVDETPLITPHQVVQTLICSHELFIWPRLGNPDQEIATPRCSHSDGLEYKYLHYVVFT